MTGSDARKALLALVAVVAIVAALGLILWALFPYLYAESGSARYAREHQGEAAVQLFGATVLLIIAGFCVRYSFSARTWLIVVAVLAAVGGHFYIRSWVRVPANVQPAGGPFHIVRVATPHEADTVYYNLYYKRGPHYQRVADLVAEYRFVAPDCMAWRGLKVVGSPMSAMCGFRKPVESYDTTAAESELLQRARSSASY